MARTVRSRVAALVVAAALLGGGVAAMRPAAAGSPVIFGANAGPRKGEGKREAVLNLEAKIGRQLSSVRVFKRWDSVFPDAFDTWLVDTHRTMFLSVKARTEAGEIVSWSEIAAAQPGSPRYDDILRWATAVRDVADPVYFTFHHEPASAEQNDGADAYIAAWRKFHQVFASVGANNVRWVWTMSDSNFWATDSRAAALWYPGDAYVDHLGVDAYNWYDCRGPTTPWTGLADLIGPFREFSLAHPDEGLVVNEWGSIEDGADPARKAQWIADAHATLGSPDSSRLVAVNYFHHKDYTYKDCQWWVDSSDASLAAFAAMGADPAFSGTAPPPEPSPTPEPTPSETASPSPEPTPSETTSPSPTDTSSPSPTASPSPPAGPGVVVGAAGDIACDPGDGSFNGTNGTANACGMRRTSDLLVAIGPDAVLTLGDNQYENGHIKKFQKSYDPTWGRLKAITHPSVGNHEYLYRAAGGYFQYFGTAAHQESSGYYSFDLGEWHLVALNSNCAQAGGCGLGSPQYEWLRADLAASPRSCSLAYWHHARFASTSVHADDPAMDDVWRLLDAYAADVILAGHNHNYERFAELDANGVPDPDGMRQFVVGTGGRNHYSIVSPHPLSVVQNTDAFGVLKLTLRATSYEWEFVPEPGKAFVDSGWDSCA